MRKMIYFLFCLSLVMTSGYCYEQKTNLSSPDKIYVSPAQLFILDHGIFAFLNDNWQQIEAIFSDNQGLFVYEQPSPDTWYCGKCRTTHRVGQRCPYEKR